jgi:precorrin-2 dehydrogenase/sirohydrochlorin ferrochelatase/precorrin-6A/cobalt-precorrin-6A reductase
MKRIFEVHRPDLVIDATHPYAVLVTANLKTACGSAGVPYLRLQREASTDDGVIKCENLEDAVKWLNQHPGAILSAIGSKEIRQLTRIENFEDRVFARILPLPEALEAAVEMGFKGSHLICMQGPFSYEMNLAMLRQYECRYLLTKDSGQTGGFREKIMAAREVGAQVVLIQRPKEEEGQSCEEVLSWIENRWGKMISGSVLQMEPIATFDSVFDFNYDTGIERTVLPETVEKLNYFPLFVQIWDKQIVVVGGGIIAARRIETLLRFQCRILVVAPGIEPSIEAHARSKRLTYLCGTYEKGNLAGADLVLAATNDRAVNHSVGLEANKLGIPVSVADAASECSFFFPSVIEHEEVVIGLCSQGKSHHGVSALSKKLRWILNHED